MSGRSRRGWRRAAIGPSWSGGRGPEDRAAPGVEVVRLPYLDRALWRRIPLLGRQYTLTKLLERLSFGLAGLPWLLRHRPQVVYIQKPYDLPVAALGRLVGIRTLFGCHGKDFWLGDRLFTRAMQASVSCSAYNAAQVHARYGIQPTVIYNGVDTTVFHPVVGDPWSVIGATHHTDHSAHDTSDHDVTDHGPPTTNPDVADHGPRTIAPIVLFAGRLVRWKGVEYLIEALPLLRTPGVSVWIAGEGPYQPDLVALAARLGVSAQVRFLGQVPTLELPALYAQADVVVGTSFVNETFGIALAEAMACARPSSRQPLRRLPRSGRRRRNRSAGPTHKTPPIWPHNSTRCSATLPAPPQWGRPVSPASSACSPGMPWWIAWKRCWGRWAWRG